MNKSNKKYLGVDWGEKRIGLAMADGETKLATPFKTVGTAADVEEITKHEEIAVVVVGNPVRITNEKYNKFIEDLKNIISAPIEFEDERLSSKAADALVGDKKTKAGRDEIAAMLILQSYLDKI